MKKILNQIDNMVVEMGKGMAKAHPDLLVFDEKYRIITRKNPDSEKVVLISGGGSGHEPAHGGFVGKGMLDAAVCGDVFASPSSVQVYNAIAKTESDAGTLLIIKNYSGDCMNFDTAAELAEDDDITVEKVYVNDDVAVEDSTYTIGRRGVAGTVFVHKIAGAAAEAGRDLAAVKAVAGKVIENVASIGFALTSCTVPAKGTPTFAIDNDEIEYGVGIHGEPGIVREKLQTSQELAEKMSDKLIAEMGLREGEEIAVMVNGFGATPLCELYLFNNDVADLLAAKGVKVYKTLVGNYMTSIDMAGASLTYLRLDSELKELLDAPTDAVGWNG